MHIPFPRPDQDPERPSSRWVDGAVRTWLLTAVLTVAGGLAALALGDLLRGVVE
ncbi:hypothetical protein [Kineococcus sp. SYSU DK003]|uniref:hypothetical protein n=1 Tax=Kineococcus sp. SYSU DK003 TaxID=3383124 RepID=UPI003D7E6C65